ncbi:MAG: TIGR04141 family sporadically distributed protein [Actinomycetota bacterium]
MTTKPKKQDFRLYLMKEGHHIEGVETTADTEEALLPSIDLNARLFTTSRRSRTHGWVTFLNDATVDSLADVVRFNLSAVLFIERAERMFALTWGPAGRFLIDRNTCERDFGLKVVLNAVDPDLLRSIDLEKFEEQTVRSRQQASRQSSIDAFGVDPTRDILNGVAGTPTNTKNGSFLFGADVLGFSARLTFDELGSACDRYLVLYGEQTYRETFSWVDNVRLVKDETVQADLLGNLVDAVRLGDTDNLYLGPPEVMDWSEFSSFQYPGADPAGAPDLDIDRFLLSFDDLGELTLANLKHETVVAQFEGDRVRSWSVLDCLCFETTFHGATYILSDGRWFRIADDFVTEVNEAVIAVEECATAFPSALKGEEEKDYCARVVEADDKPSSSPRSQACDDWGWAQQCRGLRRANG